MCSPITVNSKSVKARIIDVSVIGDNVEFNKLKNPVSLKLNGHFKKLNWITSVIVSESTKIDRIRILF